MLHIPISMIIINLNNDKLIHGCMMYIQCASYTNSHDYNILYKLIIVLYGIANVLHIPIAMILIYYTN